jgi:hypothetical protein
VSEMALYWDVTKYVAHPVAGAEIEKHIRFCHGTYRWQRDSFLGVIVDWRIGNRWINAMRSLSKSNVAYNL